MDQEHPKVDPGGSTGSQIRLLDRAHIELPEVVTVRKVENLNNLILLLRDMDANMKKISKQSQLRVKPNASSFPATKPLIKSYNSAPTKLSTAVGVAVVSPVPSTAVTYEAWEAYLLSLGSSWSRSHMTCFVIQEL